MEQHDGREPDKPQISDSFVQESGVSGYATNRALTGPSAMPLRESGEIIHDSPNSHEKSLAQICQRFSAICGGTRRGCLVFT